MQLSELEECKVKNMSKVLTPHHRVLNLGSRSRELGIFCITAGY